MRMGTSHRLLCAALAALFAAGALGCRNRGADNANNANSNYGTANGNLVTNTTQGVSDTALRNTVQANLTRAGVSGVEVEVADGVVTLKGNVPRDKMQDAVRAANDAGPKRVLNQLNAQ